MMTETAFSSTSTEGALHDCIVATLSTNDDPQGYSADELVVLLDGMVDAQQMQQELEVLVGQGILDRQGVGSGALYRLVLSASASPLRFLSSIGYGSGAPRALTAPIPSP